MHTRSRTPDETVRSGPDERFPKVAAARVACTSKDMNIGSTSSRSTAKPNAVAMLSRPLQTTRTEPAPHYRTSKYVFGSAYGWYRCADA